MTEIKVYKITQYHIVEKYKHIRHYIKTTASLKDANALICAFQLVHYDLPHELMSEDVIMIEQVLACWKHLRPHDSVVTTPNETEYLSADAEIEICENWHTVPHEKITPLLHGLPSELRKIIIQWEIDSYEGKNTLYEWDSDSFNLSVLKDILKSNHIPNDLKNCGGDNVGNTPLVKGKIGLIRT